MRRNHPTLICLALLLLSSATFLAAQNDPLADARSMLGANRISDAESLLRQYLASNAASADAHFLLGYVLFREQRGKESLAEFTEGAKYRRPKADELKVIASDYVMLGGFSDADKWFSEVVKETPNDSDAWYLLGRTKYNESEFKAAIEDFDHAILLRPHYLEAENNIGLAWRELGDKEKAKAAFETAIQWQKDHPTDAQPFLNFGTLLSDGGDYKSALGFLDQAAALAPQNPTIHEELARAYAAMEDLPRAANELKLGIDLAPSVSALHFKLGQIYRKQGLLDQAEREFAICKQLSGTQSNAKTPNPLVVK